jgi:hypothetical protein
VTEAAIAEAEHDGPAAPAATAPTRVAGSVRRITVVDMLRPDGPTGDLLLNGAGRDTRAGQVGSAELLGSATLHVRAGSGPARTVTRIGATPDLPALQGLVGCAASSGSRRAAAAAVPGELARRSVLYQLLDDVPVTALISGYALVANQRPVRFGHARIAEMIDLCAGYQADGVMQWIDRQGWVPTVYGPKTPAVVTDDAWPDLADLPPNAMRRHRLLDVARVADGTVRVYAWFRDVFQRPDGERTIVHEYEIDATIDPATATVLEIVATPRVLPWRECPQAAASAERLRGTSLANVREDVRAGFVGRSTCTHLNDQLRSLADVVELAQACGPPS